MRLMHGTLAAVFYFFVASNAHAQGSIQNTIAVTDPISISITSKASNTAERAFSAFEKDLRTQLREQCNNATITVDPTSNDSSNSTNGTTSTRRRRLKYRIESLEMSLGRDNGSSYLVNGNVTFTCTVRA